MEGAGERQPRRPRQLELFTDLPERAPDPPRFHHVGELAERIIQDVRLRLSELEEIARRRQAG